jgi:hypothetical protein
MYVRLFIEVGFSLRVRARGSRVGFVAGKVALGQVSLSSLSGLPCQYHSTAAPYSLVYHLGDVQRQR